MQKFTDLSLLPTLLKNIEAVGYETPSPIQAQAIPFLLEGHDLLGIAQTGTGKTAAFTLPMLQHLAGRDFSLTPNEPRSLILAPTRELASQIKASLDKYGKDLKLKNAVIFGGVGQSAQVAALRNGLDILIATPGRLLDLMNQGHLKLGKVEIFVLDEADRMLDMGFINDIKKIVPKLPEKKQTLLFSATMPTEIASLAAKLLKNPKRVEVTPPSTTVERIDQKVIFCPKADKYQLLKKVLAEESTELTLVFTRTKHGANRIVDYLAHFQIHSAAIHGNKSQNAREEALKNFKAGLFKVLIATDIAARGIDVPGVSHVVNFDLPLEAESYVHRIGRTARAGKDGIAISFCDETERDALSRIQKLIGLKLPTDNFKGVPEASVKISKPQRPFRDPRRRPQNKSNNNNNNNNASSSNSNNQEKSKVGFRFRNKK
jgi:ATP-dependent RNA helicase RhlE